MFIRKLIFCWVFVLSVASSAFAQTTCAVPNSLTNGTTADATAVMGNFNALNGCINSLNQIVSGTPLAGFRNRITNGGIDVDQRNSGSAQTITSIAAYTVDRWFAYATGANVTGQQTSAVGTGFLNEYQFTGAASVTGIAFGQRIETNNSYDLAGGTATLSVYLSDSSLTTVTWTASYANATDNFSSVTQIATGSFTVTSSLARYSANIAIPSNATTGLQVVLSVGAQGAGSHWTITGAQLEPAPSPSTPTPTAFERLPSQVTFSLCARRFQILHAEMYGYSTTGGGFAQYNQFPVLMASTPIATILNQTYNNASAFTIDTITTTGFRARANITSGPGGGYVTQTNISFSSEL